MNQNSANSGGAFGGVEGVFRELFSEERANELAAMIEYANERASRLIKDYQNVFNSDNGDYIRDINLLPDSKERIKKAYVLHFSQIPESENFQLFKEVLHLYFFGERQENCTIEDNYLFSSREMFCGNSEARTILFTRHAEDKEVQDHWMKGAEANLFEEKANIWRVHQINDFTQLATSMSGIVSILAEFADGKWPQDLYLDLRSTLEKVQKTSGQAGGCASLLLVSLLPVAIYAVMNATG